MRPERGVLLRVQPHPYTTDDDASVTRKKASFGRQALRREVNERAAEAGRARGDATVEILCECGLTGCTTKFEIDAERYEQVRLFATHFVIAAGHDAGEERVIASDAAFAIVEKFGPSGLAAVRFDRRRRRRVGA
jgi:hypothetical protein